MLKYVLICFCSVLGCTYPYQDEGNSQLSTDELLSQALQWRQSAVKASHLMQTFGASFEDQEQIIQRLESKEFAQFIKRWQRCFQDLRSHVSEVEGGSHQPGSPMASAIEVAAYSCQVLSGALAKFGSEMRWLTQHYEKLLAQTLARYLEVPGQYFAAVPLASHEKELLARWLGEFRKSRGQLEEAIALWTHGYFAGFVGEVAKLLASLPEDFRPPSKDLTTGIDQEYRNLQKSLRLYRGEYPNQYEVSATWAGRLEGLDRVLYDGRSAVAEKDRRETFQLATAMAQNYRFDLIAQLGFLSRMIRERHQHVAAQRPLRLDHAPGTAVSKSR